jgi:prophage regulatory protein
MTVTFCDYSIAKGTPVHQRISAAQKIVLTRDDLKAMGINKSNTTLLRWEASGRFPRRIRLAGTTVAWIASEIDEWLTERATERSSYFYADPRD